MPDAPTRRLLALLVALFVLGGAAFAVATPLFQNPDEPSHLDLAHHYAHDPLHLVGPSLRIRQGTVDAVDAVGLPAAAGDVTFDAVPAERPSYGSLHDGPGADESAATGCPAACQQYQYAHPPGWYLAMAPIVRAVDGLSFPSVLLVLRLVNVALVAAAVPLTWYAARQVWPEAVRRPLVAAAAVAVCGPYLATAAAVNNDAAVLLLAAAAIALMAHVLRCGATVRSAALLGAVVGAGLLVKGPFLVVAPLAGLAVLAAPPAVARWRSALAYGVPALLGASWWLNTIARDGSITPDGSELVAADRDGPWQQESFFSYVGDHLGDVHERIFGLYGWASVEAPAGWRTVLGLAAIGVLLAWLGARRWRRPTASGLRWLLLAALPVGLLLAAFQASFDVYVANGEVRGLAPRYLYPALPVAALGLVAAGGAVARHLPRPAVRWGAAALVAVLALVAGAGSFWLAATGLHDTTSLAQLADRLRVVSPAGGAPGWLAVLAAGWLCVAGGVVTLLARVDPAARTSA